MADNKGNDMRHGTSHTDESKQKDMHQHDKNQQGGASAEVGRSGAKDKNQDREHMHQSGHNAGEMTGNRGGKNKQ